MRMLALVPMPWRPRMRMGLGEGEEAILSVDGVFVGYSAAW